MNIETSKIKTCELKIDRPLPRAKSQGQIGNITVNFSKTFNWLQRKMWKICCGVDIKNIEE